MTYTASAHPGRESKVPVAGEWSSPQEPHAHASDGTDATDNERDAGPDDRPLRAGVLRAQLPAGSQAHRLATRTLLEGLSLFCDARLRVVLSAESEELSCAQGLSDGFGFGVDTLHYEVDIAPSASERRRGVGSFRDVRRLRPRKEEGT